MSFDPLSLTMITVYTGLIVIPLVYNYLGYGNRLNNINKEMNKENKLPDRIGELPRSLVILINNPDEIDIDKIVDALSS